MKNENEDENQKVKLKNWRIQLTDNTEGEDNTCTTI